MVAKGKEGTEQKANLYLLAIVAIVAVVGVVVLVLNAGGVSVSSADLSGEALKVKSVSDLSSVKTIKIGTGSKAIVVQATDCGDSCEVCGCDSNGENCKCQD